MCRLFGFRSIIPSKVHQSLVGAENALMLQSERHPDGWGVAYYLDGAPHVIKSATGAMDDHLFHHVSGIVSSQTVIAHVRNATHGTHSIINSHPFQYGRWIFAHNGDIPHFGDLRERALAMIPPNRRRFILGNTDSEVLFHLLLTHMERRAELTRENFTLNDLVDAIRETVEEVHRITGLNCYDDDNRLFLTFLITNGGVMVGHQGGKELRYSTYKAVCLEKDTCSNYRPSCEAPTTDGFVQHMLFGSEELDGKSIWSEMNPGEIVGVNWRMEYSFYESPRRVALKAI